MSKGVVEVCAYHMAVAVMVQSCGRPDSVKMPDSDRPFDHVSVPCKRHRKITMVREANAPQVRNATTKGSDTQAYKGQRCVHQGLKAKSFPSLLCVCLCLLCVCAFCALYASTTRAHLSAGLVIVELALEHILAGIRQLAMPVPQPIPPVPEVHPPIGVGLPAGAVGEEVVHLARVHAPVLPHHLDTVRRGDRDGG